MHTLKLERLGSGDGENIVNANTTDSMRAVACGRLVRLWWWFKIHLWLWRWRRWLKRIHRMETSAALIEITRYKWLVTHAGCSEKWEEVFLRALAITDESVRSKEK